MAHVLLQQAAIFLKAKLACEYSLRSLWRPSLCVVSKQQHELLSEHLVYVIEGQVELNCTFRRRGICLAVPAPQHCHFQYPDLCAQRGQQLGGYARCSACKSSLTHSERFGLP